MTLEDVERADDLSINTPEVKEFTQAKIDVRKTNQKIFRTVFITAILTALIVIGVIIGYEQVFRNTQICGIQGQNAMLHDINLLLQKDQNRSDYILHITCT